MGAWTDKLSGCVFCCRWALFKTPITRETVIFISLSMLGGFMYSYSKLKEAETKAETKPQDK
jgi:hypothetical protein